ncbi:hypothetical protein [Arundinibacter roseus]|uniref:Uncharacterized protein n=1 Tax=Arundinibacter roseus TaxID=2070510 RepID=A0A4R4K1L2_9BACT|nr:hypothetical protein [Arundinibacter roseus]TDB61108.1 hypothetical protein EZE20_19765 [Arundinibacter roseus]
MNDSDENEENVAPGSPVGSKPANENKHVDNSQKPAEQLDDEISEEFESHNANTHRGYNETKQDVPVKKVNLSQDKPQKNDDE